jgi:hypothetical protein
MSTIEDDLRKSLKYIYDDLIDAESNQEKEPFGFKNRLQVIYETLQDQEMRICAVFGLGDFGVLPDFESEYLKRGESGMSQMIKSQIKLLAVEIGLDLGSNTISETRDIVNKDPNNSKLNYLLLKNLEENIRKFIEIELSESTPQWWKQRIPGDVKTNAEERKEKDEKRKIWDFKEQSLISYIDFTDYEKIITQKNNWNDIFRDVFHDKVAISGKLKAIEPIRNTISHTRNLDPHEIKQLKFYSEEILKSISYYLEHKSKIISEKIKTVEPITSIPISVSFDRTVYPINSTVHLRANVPKLIVNEPLIFQIFNSKHKMIFERRISYNDIPSKELGPGAGIYETSFTMDENWKIGEKYVLKGKHGMSEILSETRVDTREPVIQSDKFTYLWGTDMILTIIDPDADRDNQVVEFVGDREDAKLTIETSRGKLENYRLRETGNSTGIFQGIIGFIGVNDDGTKVPYDLNGTLIDTTQGTQVDDGFIEVSKNDELVITYSNATRGTRLLAYVIKQHLKS